MKHYEQMNFYELLGVPVSASVEEICAAYRELARVYHPDSTYYDEIITNHSDDVDQEFIQILTLAFNTLVDPEKRKLYDHSLRQQGESGRPFGEVLGSCSLNLRREILASQLNGAWLPSYKEIEAIAEHPTSVADLIRIKRETESLAWLARIAFLLLTIIAVCTIWFADRLLK